MEKNLYTEGLLVNDKPLCCRYNNGQTIYVVVIKVIYSVLKHGFELMEFQENHYEESYFKSHLESSLRSLGTVHISDLLYYRLVNDVLLHESDTVSFPSMDINSVMTVKHLMELYNHDRLLDVEGDLIGYLDYDNAIDSDEENPLYYVEQAQEEDDYLGLYM